MDITDEEGPAWITFVIADCPSLKVLEIKPAAFAFFRSSIAVFRRFPPFPAGADSRGYRRDRALGRDELREAARGRRCRARKRRNGVHRSHIPPSKTTAAERGTVFPERPN